MVALNPLTLDLVDPSWADAVVACPADGFDAADLDAFAARLGRVRQRAFRSSGEPGFALYRLVGQGHELLGVVGDLDVGSEPHAWLRPHEQTEPAREAAMARHRRRVGADTSPVMVGFPSQPALDRLLADLADEVPAVSVTTSDDVRHEIVCLTDPGAVATVAREVARLPHGYLLDGHHRAAAAGRDPRTRRVLAALFPLHQVHPLGYHRVVRRASTDGSVGGPLSDASTEALWAAVGARFAVEPVADAADARPRDRGEMALRFDGSWVRLRPRPDLVPARLPDRLDEAVVRRHLLEAVLGVTDPPREGTVAYVPGTVGPDELERATDPRDLLVVLAAPPMTDFQAVADAGTAFPPKSTYFAPKPAVGLLLARRRAVAALAPHGDAAAAEGRATARHSPSSTLTSVSTDE